MAKPFAERSFLWMLALVFLATAALFVADMLLAETGRRG